MFNDQIIPTCTLDNRSLKSNSVNRSGPIKTKLMAESQRPPEQGVPVRYEVPIKKMGQLKSVKKPLNIYCLQSSK